jgi:hypothetical protein
LKTTYPLACPAPETSLVKGGTTAESTVKHALKTAETMKKEVGRDRVEINPKLVDAK